MDERLATAGSRASAMSHLKLVTARNGYAVAGAIVLLSLWITAGALSKSYLIGRLAFPATHNDVNYLIDGIRRLVYIETHGFWAEIAHLYLDPMHAPLAGYQAAFGFYLFGFHDWAPYATDIGYLWISLAFSAALLRDRPAPVIIAGLIALSGVPILYSTVSEFAPEIPCGLFTALGVVLALRISALERTLMPRALAGLCFGFGMLAKPSSFAFVPLVVCAVLGVTFVRDVLVPKRLRESPTAAKNGLLQIAFSLWLPAFYLVPNFGEYAHYFYLAMLDPANVRKFASYHSIRDDIVFYFTGDAGQYMFGNLFWAYLGAIALGIAAAWRRSDWKFLGNQAELFAIVVFMWVLATAPDAKNMLFGAPFGFLLLFMIMMAIGSIYETVGGTRGIYVVSFLSVLLFVSGTPFSRPPNTPGFEWYNRGAHVIREQWPKAMGRFRAVMLGNSPNYHERSVYDTNSGYYFGPVLWYFFLKKDPTLDWIFVDPLWGDENPQDHLDLIRQRHVEFVIAGERDNGLTYGPSLYSGASAAENAVLAAMRRNPDYMALDQFYGPTGRTITVFQRSTAFAGWRPLGGLVHRGEQQPWISMDKITHLAAYSPVAISARLMLDVQGTAGESIDVIVNQNQIGSMHLDTAGKGTLTDAFGLAPGDNDIILKYSTAGPTRFNRLVLIRKISQD